MEMPALRRSSARGPVEAGWRRRAAGRTRARGSRTACSGPCAMVEWCTCGPRASKNPWQMEQRLSLITLGVADLARARSFYEALGWTTGAQPADDVVFFQTGCMVVALWGRGRLEEDSGVV